MMHPLSPVFPVLLRSRHPADILFVALAAFGLLIMLMIAVAVAGSMLL